RVSILATRGAVVWNGLDPRRQIVVDFPTVGRVTRPGIPAGWPGRRGYGRMIGGPIKGPIPIAVAEPSTERAVPGIDAVIARILDQPGDILIAIAGARISVEGTL